MTNLGEFKFPTNGKGLLLKGSAALLIGITFGIILLDLAGLPKIILLAPSGQNLLKRFSSYEELKTFMNKSISSGPYFYEDLRGAASVLAQDSSFNLGAVEYSKTNIQVEGVDEADILKSDGEYIYLVSDGEVLIVKAYPPTEAAVASRIELNGSVIGLFINKNRLAILAEESPYFVLGVRKDYVAPIIYGESQAFIKVYDIENRTEPILTRNVSLNGSYFNSRMIGSYVYVLINTPAYIRDEEVPLPSILQNGRVEKIEASSIYYSNVSDYYNTFTTIIAINVQNDEEEIVHETFLLGYSSCIYVSLSNIYLAIRKYGDDGSQKTEIHRIHIENSRVTYEKGGEVPGYILNQFSMDEYGEYFRIATTTTNYVSGSLEQLNHVYVLNLNLTIVGKLENIAPRERIYSARFMGERCYLVTFKKVDPLFVISLENPYNPAILGNLKIPGYSDYLHPYDENHLIGIGKETVEAEEGDWAWYQGVKISLFNVTDLAHPEETDKYIIGDRGTDSPVLRDHKALLFDTKRNLFVIPVLVAKIDESKYPGGVPANAYGDYVWQGVYVFNVTESNITLRGRITHIEDEADFLKSGYYFSSEYSVERSLYIDNVLYTISDKKIKMNSLTNLEEINEIELP